MKKTMGIKKDTYRIRSKVWLYPGMAGWHFLILPKKQSEKINQDFGAKKRGWGSLPVRVTLRTTSWETSIFPDTREGAYLLPLKAEIRKKEKLYADDTVTFTIELRV